MASVPGRACSASSPDLARDLHRYGGRAGPATILPSNFPRNSTKVNVMRRVDVTRTKEEGLRSTANFHSKCGDLLSIFSCTRNNPPAS